MTTEISGSDCKGLPHLLGDVGRIILGPVQSILPSERAECAFQVVDDSTWCERLGSIFTYTWSEMDIMIDW